MTPRVSVILNSYNQGRFLAETIESALAQRYGDFELLIIDNGSTDQSQSIARDFAARDGRITLSLHDENRSLSLRQNEGVARARGEFVSFLYSDDLYLPHKLERQLELFAAHPEAGVVYAPARGLNVLTGEKFVHPCLGRSGMILRALLTPSTTGWIDMLSPLIRKEALTRYPFQEDLFAEGESVYFRIAMRWPFHFDPEPVVVLRDHDANIGKAIRRNHENFIEMLARMERHPDFPDELRSLLPAYRAHTARNAGWQAIRMGADDMAWARGRFTQALREHWPTALHPRTVIGLGMTLLPRRARQRLNALGFAVRRSSTNAVYREELR
ncbi:MAG TPA: glycosyltransferase family 2 protein [Polyangia bacterium]|jgi:glycosyltransferase involved in cell wall biosynthesis